MPKTDPLIAKNVRHYSLTLADGKKWTIVASKNTASWVNELSRLMRLKQSPPNSAGSRLIICKKIKWHDNAKRCIEDLDGITIDNLPARGWIKEPFYTTVQAWLHPDVPDVIFEIGNMRLSVSEYAKMWHCLYSIYERILDKGGFTCHAALIERRRKGYLLVGPGGIGKSTCCRRLPLPWVPLCDDEVLIVPDGRGSYHAHPFPTWSYYLNRHSKPTWDVQYHVPVKGIFFLKQTTKDKILPIGQGQAAVSLNNQALIIFSLAWGRRYDAEKVRILRKKLFKSVSGLSLRVPAFILGASRYGKFWEEMEKVIGSR